jgi:hypothetical protein
LPYFGITESETTSADDLSGFGLLGADDREIDLGLERGWGIGQQTKHIWGGAEAGLNSLKQGFGLSFGGSWIDRM